MRVHHERPPRRDRLVDGLPGQQQHLRVLLRRRQPQRVPAEVHQRHALLLHLLILLADRDLPAAHEHDGVVPLRDRHVERNLRVGDANVQELHRRVGVRGSLASVRRLVARDDPDGVLSRELLPVFLVGALEGNHRDVLRQDGLVSRLFHLVLLGQVQPKLRHLKHAAGLLEIRRVELLVDDATRRGHPLHVARADDVAISDRIAVLDLALPRDCDGLESAMGMLPDSSSLVARLEFLGRRVVEHEPRGELLRERLVVKHGEHVEAVANPVPGRGSQDLANLLELLLSHCGRVYRSAALGRAECATEG